MTNFISAGVITKSGLSGNEWFWKLVKRDFERSLLTLAFVCFQVGKNVLNQKSELQKAMEKHRDQAARKEAEKEKLTNKTAFEKVIEERARRLESVRFFSF